MQRNTSTTTVTLRDGERLSLRLIEPTDDDAFLAAFDRAPAPDLRRRFLGTPPPPARLLRYLHHADGDHDLVVGAFTRDGRLVAVGQFDRGGSNPQAELAIEVGREFQRRGLATLMLADLERRAHDHGVQTLVANCYSDNLAVRALLRSTGQIVDRSSDYGITTYTLDLTRPLNDDSQTEATGQDQSPGDPGRAPLDPYV